MNSRIGFNVQHTPDRSAFLSYVQKLQPKALVVINDLDLCKLVKSLLPATIVIHRQHPDDGRCHPGAPEYQTPEAFVAERVRQFGGVDLWAYTANEPGFNTETFDWHVRAMDAAGKVGLKLVIGNFAVGTTPGDAAGWGAASEMVRKACAARDRVILGLHEYWGGVVTSGFIGGWPDNAGVQPGTTGGKNLVPTANWPASTKGMTLWHCGRFRNLEAYCTAIGIQTPRIILTEHGADALGDIKPWLDGQPKTAPFTELRGWKSCSAAWNAWWPSWTRQRAFYEQIAYADRAIYQGSAVEAQCVFLWGHLSADWEQFDVSDAGELQGLLLQQNTQPPVVTTPPIVTPPVVTPPVVTPPTLPTTPPPAVPINWTPDQLQQLICYHDLMSKSFAQIAQTHAQMRDLLIDITGGRL